MENNEKNFNENLSPYGENADTRPYSEKSDLDMQFESYYTGGHHSRHRHHRKRRRSKKKKTVIILSVILGICILVCGGVSALMFHYIGKINTNAGSYKLLDSVADDDLTNNPDSDKTDIERLEQQIRDNMEKNSQQLIFSENVYNILLIGTDSREENSADYGRSDTMILLSINKESKEIIMTSFMRDIYVSIPGVSQSNRLNAAYAYGGPDLLVDTIEKNFKIKIDKYAQIDFFSFITVVDSIGGVEINVSQEELGTLNSYVENLNTLTGDPAGTDLLTSFGKQTLNGKQALAYSRIRYVGNADFERTQRQRTVLAKVISKAKGLSIIEINKMLDVLLPEITTNLSEGEIFSLVLNSPAYFGYSMVQARVPADGTWEYLTIRSMSVLGIDFKENIEYLKKKIYHTD